MDGMGMIWKDFYEAFYFLEDYRTEWNHSLVKNCAVEQNFAVGTNMETLKGKTWCFFVEKKLEAYLRTHFVEVLGTVDGSEIRRENQLIWRIHHYLQGFIRL